MRLNESIDGWCLANEILHRIRSFGLFMPSTITSLYKKSHDSERQVQYDLTLILRVRHYLNIRWPLIACHLVKRLISRQNCFYSGNFYKFYDAPNQREGSSHVHSLIRKRYKPAGMCSDLLECQSHATHMFDKFIHRIASGCATEEHPTLTTRPHFRNRKWSIMSCTFVLAITF